MGGLEGGEIHFILYLFFIIFGGIRLPMPKTEIKSFWASARRGGEPPGSKLQCAKYGIDLPPSSSFAPSVLDYQHKMSGLSEHPSFGDFIWEIICT